MNIHPEYFIYGFGDCIGCDKAKALCENYGKQYVFIKLKEDKQAKKLLGLLSKEKDWSLGQIQIPAIYRRSEITVGSSFNFTYIGNHEALQQLLEDC
ncbi:hypothetical protein L4D76_25035 [Photobacterium sagamiensis]|uniref:hypothetical protein n=1 Tax=Photobacterium sagamiensis TaxID=2910241 RepID=UPI003D12E8FD